MEHYSRIYTVFLAISTFAFAEYTEVADTVLLFDCWSLTCQQSWLSDSVCDPSCMTPMCNYDSHDDESDTWLIRFFSSDCLNLCLDLGCPISPLGNGVCDASCNFVECGYDLGDCGYCADGCSLDLLNNEIPDEVCNTPECRFDNNAFGWCAPGCFQEDLENDTCDEQCSSLDCENDQGHCEVELCAENCRIDSLGDGHCDYFCFNEDCKFDLGDCDCSPGCSDEDLELPCSAEDPCDTEACAFKEGKCGFCASGCFEADLANGVCDPACNTEACEYDNGACACSPGCETYYDITASQWQSVSSCNQVDCMTASCQYLFFDSEGCQDQGTIEYYFLYQAINQDSSGIPEEYNCECSVAELREMLDAQSCSNYEHCNTAGCMFCMGFGYQDCPKNCDYCDDNGNCLRCTYKQIFGTCLDEDEDCPKDYEELRFDSGLILCVPEPGKSWPDQPVEFYVYASSTEAESSENSYSSLAAALEAVYAEYTKIYLSEGVHYFVPNTDVTSPLQREYPANMKQVIIEGTTDSELRLYNQHMMSLDVDGFELVLKNIVISGQEFLEPGCNEEYCMYCQAYTEFNGEYFDDRNQVIEHSFPMNCDDFSEYVLIAVAEGSLVLEDVSFTQLRFTPYAIIRSLQDVNMTNVNFWKVQPHKDGAVIFILEEGSIYYTGGSVQYLNDGYELSSLKVLGSFLVGTNFVSARIQDVTFAYCLVYDIMGGSGEFDLINFYTFRGSIEISSCEFRDIMVFTLFKIDTLELIEIDPEIDRFFIGQAASRTHFLLSNNRFFNVITFQGILEYSMGSFVHNIELAGNTFERILAYYAAIIVQNSYIFDEEVVESRVETELIDGTRVEYIILPQRIIIEDCSFKSVKYYSSALVMKRLANVEFNAVEYEDSGFSEADIVNTWIMNSFINASDSYIEMEADLSTWENFECRAGFQLETIINLQFHDFTMKNITCDLDANRRGGLVLSDITGDSNLISNLYVTSMPPALSDGYILEAKECSELVLFNLTVTNVHNSDRSLIQFKQIESVKFQELTVSQVSCNLFSPITLNQVSQFQLFDSTFEHTSSLQGNGGVFLYRCTSIGEKECLVEVRDSTFHSISAGGRGGVFVFTSDSYKTDAGFYLSNLTFTNCSAQSGAVYFIEEHLSPEYGSVSDISISESAATTSGLIDDNHYMGYISYNNLHIFRNTGSYCGLFGTFHRDGEAILDLTASLFEYNECKEGQNFFMQFALGWVIGTDVTFYRNSGAAFYMASGLYYLTNITLSENEAGLELYFTGYLSATTVLCNFQSSCIEVTGGGFLNCDECIFEDNYGTPIINTAAGFYVKNSVFRRNVVDEGSAAMTLYVASEWNRFENTTFVENHSGELGLVGAVGSYFEVGGCIVDSNTATEGETPGFFLNAASVSISDSTFSNQHATEAFFIDGIDTGITIVNSQFTNGSGTSGAAIHATVGTISIQDSTLKGLSSTGEGAAIHVESNVKLTLVRTTIEEVTSAQGSAVYAVDVDIELDGVIIRNCNASAFYVQITDSTTIANSLFENNSGYSGAATRIIQPMYFTVTNSTFRQNTATSQGGALSLEPLTAFDSLAEFVISNSSFENCTATAGGAIYTINSKVALSHVSVVNSSVSSEGGGLYYRCPQNSDCYTHITDSNFTGNSADLAGGAIRWVDKYPVISNTNFADNTAFYGGDIASYPTAIARSNNRRLEETPIEIAPGQTTTVPLQVDLLDQYGNVVVTDNESQASLITFDPDASFSGITKTTAVNGTFTFDNFILSYPPNSTLTITVYSEGVDLSLKETTEDENEYIQEIPVEFFLRDCELGEENTGTQCLVCEPGFYSLVAGTACNLCPSEAHCPGGWTIYPRANYWRPSDLSDTFYECPNIDACLGSPDFQNLLGVCEEGYTGNMCQACAVDYSRSQENTCSRCPEPTWNALKLLGTSFLVIGFCVFLVRSTLASAHTPKALHSIYLKILTNYIQIVFLTTQFNLEWPEVVLALFSVQRSTAQVSDQVVSFDCYLGSSYDAIDYHHVYFDKLVLLSILPMVVALVSVAFWLVVGLRRNNFGVLRQELVTTLIVLLFFLHPSLTKVYFSAFACREIEGHGSWLVENLDIECWGETHSFYALAVAMPSLMIWGFGIPALILIILIRNRLHLLTLSNRVRFGFLFNGYKVSKFYWEFVIVYRKMLVICLAVFLSTISIPVQALSVMLLLLLSLYLQGRYQPYSLKHLNRMETIAVLVASITIYCGLYFLTRHLSDDWKLFLFILMVYSNTLFVAYWLKHMFEHFFSIIIWAIPYCRKKYNTADGLSSELFVKQSMTKYSYTNEIGHRICTLMKNTPEPLVHTRDNPLKDIMSFTDLYLDNVSQNIQDIIGDQDYSF